MEKVIIRPEAMRVIRDECAKHSGQETGGTLSGREAFSADRVCEVFAATGPGPQATHNWGSFAPDVEWVNAELKRIRQTHPGSDYIGSYHKHPGKQAIPSGWDLKQAKEIIADRDYKNSTFLVIIACDDPNGTRAYVLHKGDADFKEAQLVVASPETIQVSPHSDAILAEITQLGASGWITERRRAPDGKLVLNIRKAGSNVVLSFLVPNDYPRSRPDILAQTQTPWPQGSPDIGSAAAKLLATDSLVPSQQVADLVDVLRRRGLSAQILRQSEGSVTLALRYPGLGNAGFMIVPDGVGEPSIYGADLQFRDLPSGTGLDAWADETRRTLVGDFAQHVDRRLRVRVGLAAMAIGLAGLLRDRGSARDIIVNLRGRFRR